MTEQCIIAASFHYFEPLSRSNQTGQRKREGVRPPPVRQVALNQSDWGRNKRIGKGERERWQNSFAALNSANSRNRFQITHHKWRAPQIQCKCLGLGREGAAQPTSLLRSKLQCWGHDSRKFTMVTEQLQRQFSYLSSRSVGRWSGPPYYSEST